jgi:hypothetical protein
MTHPRHLTDLAALQGAAALGLGPVTGYLGTSMSAAYATANAVLRVTASPERGDGDGAAATLAVATAAAQVARAARPLHARPFTVDVGGVDFTVEAYERVHATRPTTPADLGAALARLHSVDPALLPPGGGAPRGGLPAGRRLAVCRQRVASELARTSSSWRGVASRIAGGLDTLADLAGTFDTPQRLTHQDPSLGNVLVDARGPVWIDWEYGGRGPAALDVALAFGEMCRFHGHDAAGELLGAYQLHGGAAPPAHVMLLLSARDLCGAADLFPAADTPRWERAARQRLDTLAEPAMTSRWNALADLAGDLPPDAA